MATSRRPFADCPRPELDLLNRILPRVAGSHAAERMARRRLRVLVEPFAIDRRPLEIGESAGIALYPDDGRDADTLMRPADAAMYAARRRGAGPAIYRSRKAT